MFSVEAAVVGVKNITEKVLGKVFVGDECKAALDDESELR